MLLNEIDESDRVVNLAMQIGRKHEWLVDEMSRATESQGLTIGCLSCTMHVPRLSNDGDLQLKIAKGSFRL